MNSDSHLKIERITSLTRRYLIFSFRDMGMLSGIFFWPALDIIVWGFSALWVENNSFFAGYPLFLLTGLLFLQIAVRVYMDLSFSFFEEMRSAHIATLFSTPLSIKEWILSVIATGLIKAIVVASYIILLIWLLYNISLFNQSLSILFFLAPVIIFSWAAGILTVGLFFITGSGMHSIMYAYKTTCKLFSGLFYPLIFLPVGIRWAAYCLPLHYSFSGLREFYASGHLNTSLIIKGNALALFYLIISFLIFRWLLDKSIERGLSALDTM